MNSRRKRELIFKPFYCGAPIFSANKFFRNQLNKFREEHQEFDRFLKELDVLLKKEHYLDFLNLIKFIEGEAETNWISSDDSLFEIFIKLYNLCFSPEQAFNYILDCYKEYKTLSKIHYHLGEDYEEIIKKSNKCTEKFISFSIVPSINEIKWESQFWFDITTSLKVYEYVKKDVKIHLPKFELITSDTKIEDTLKLFVYYQDRDFLNNVYNLGIKELENKRVIYLVSSHTSSTETYYQYETTF